MTKLLDKLLKVQRELKAPKGQFNSYSKFNYRSAEDILEAVKPLNAENGLVLTLSDEPILVGERYYIKATARIETTEEHKEITAYARESQVKKGMDDSQITGTASSYARKYALNGLYLIDDTKDADTDEYQNTNRQNNIQTQSQDKQVAKEIVIAKLLQGGLDKDGAEKWYTGQASKGVTHNQMDEHLTKRLQDKEQDK